MRNDISLSYISECMVLELGGVLRWRWRPLWHFKDASYQARWNNKYAGAVAGSSTEDGHIKLNFNFKGERRTVLAHRVVWALSHGEWPPSLIDHENRIGSDNRPDNLRLASATQNSCNQSLRSDNTSGYRGVSWAASCGKWWASARVDGRKKSLGYFDDPKDAWEAYKRAVLENHGEFANPCFAASMA